MNMQIAQINQQFIHISREKKTEKDNCSKKKSTPNFLKSSKADHF